MSVQSNLKSFLLSKSKESNEQSTSEKVDYRSESEGASSDIKCDAKSSLGPSYPDIATLSEADLQKPEIKRSLLNGTWDGIDRYVFPMSR